MADPQVQYIEYGNGQVSSGKTLDEVKSAIASRNKIAVNALIAGIGQSVSNGLKVTIKYHTGDGRWKQRTLEPGQSFNFAYDIKKIKFPNEITDASAYEKIFGYMDTSGEFKVTTDLFGSPERGNKDRLLIEYYRPSLPHPQKPHCNQLKFPGEIYKFSDTNGEDDDRPAPNPPKPDPKKCLCLCPICAQDHLTEEQRKERDERKRKEELDRQLELDELKESLRRTQELARNALTGAEQANQGVKENKGDIQNIYREIADIRAVLGTIGRGGGGRHNCVEISPLFKVCIVSSQILALVVLGEYTWRAIIQGKRV